MNPPVFTELGGGIYCIDALYTAPDIACCYLIESDGEYAFFETGTSRSVDNILATLRALGVATEAIRYIIPTHVHLDHAGGAGALQQICQNAELLIHARGLRHLLDPGKLIASAEQVYGAETFARLYGEITPAVPERSRAIDDGEIINLGSRQLTVLYTRGHADHHACFHDSQSNSWFTGDMFGVSYPRQRHAAGTFVMPATTPTQFEPALYAASVDELARSRPSFMYLTHYGALPFDDRQVELLKDQLDAYTGLGLEGPADVTALEDQVLDVTRSALERVVTPERAAEEMALLRIDARLNAQGIAWWGQKLRARQKGE